MPRLRDDKIAWYENLPFDFGDAPAPYPSPSPKMVPGTMPSPDPRHHPRHGSRRHPYLQLQMRMALMRMASSTAGSSLYVGQTNATVAVNVQDAPSGARLDAWMDFRPGW